MMSTCIYIQISWTLLHVPETNNNVHDLLIFMLILFDHMEERWNARMDNTKKRAEQTLRCRRFRHCLSFIMMKVRGSTIEFLWRFVMFSCFPYDFRYFLAGVLYINMNRFHSIWISPFFQILIHTNFHLPLFVDSYALRSI